MTPGGDTVTPGLIGSPLHLFATELGCAIPDQHTIEPDRHLYVGLIGPSFRNPMDTLSQKFDQLKLRSE